MRYLLLVWEVRFLKTLVSIINKVGTKMVVTSHCTRPANTHL